MDTPAATPNPQPAAQQPAKGWDDYFPLINKAIMFGILILAVVFVTGVDVTQLTNRLSNHSEAAPVVSPSSLPVLSGGFPSVSLSVTGPGGWKVIVGLIVALASITGVVFAILSSSGLDAAWTKEQQAKLKEKEKPKQSAQAAANDDGECNLTSYKMFFAPKEEPAPASDAATPTTPS